MGFWVGVKLVEWHDAATFDSCSLCIWSVLMFLLIDIYFLVYLLHLHPYSSS